MSQHTRLEYPEIFRDSVRYNVDWSDLIEADFSLYFGRFFVCSFKPRTGLDEKDHARAVDYLNSCGLRNYDGHASPASVTAATPNPSTSHLEYWDPKSEEDMAALLHLKNRLQQQNNELYKQLKMRELTK